MILQLSGWAQDREKEGLESQVHFEEEIEWPTVPEKGALVRWNTRLRNTWRVADVCHNVISNKIEVELR